MADLAQIDRSLKRENTRIYLRTLRAMHELRREGAYSISWDLLSERTGVPRDDRIDRAALELKAAGFFDQRSRDLTCVLLTDEEFEQGWKRSYCRVRRLHFAQSPTGRAIRRARPLTTWLAGNVGYDVLKFAIPGGALLLVLLVWRCLSPSSVETIGG
jgi:hypothetical protein